MKIRILALQTSSRAFKEDQKVKKRYHAVVICQPSGHRTALIRQVIKYNNDNQDADLPTPPPPPPRTALRKIETISSRCAPSSPCGSGGDSGEIGGTIDCALKGFSAVTKWNMVGDPVPSLRFRWLTMLDLFPFTTGRKRQLRRHCALVLSAA